jgi:hypothetical protein
MSDQLDTNVQAETEWAWPDWVPAKAREQIEKFYIHHGGAAGWRASARSNGAPALDQRWTTPASMHPLGWPVQTGRFVFAWNNIGRLALDDGTMGYTAFTDNSVREQGVEVAS